MWSARPNRDQQSVVCIACGDALPRREAREYDKEGDRWERRGKEFEYLCKSCHREQCHQPRDELESLLVDVEAEHDVRPSAEGFLRAYQAAVYDRYGGTEADAEGDSDAGRE